VSLLAAACGGGDGGSPTTAAGLPPLVLGAGERTVSLAPAGGCVRRADRVVCGDPPAPSCADPALPRLPLAPGAALTMEFPERPRRVEAALGAGPPLRTRPAGRSVRWVPARTPARPSPLVVLADLGVGRLAYLACVVPTG
jgi:hypothetical protein